MKERRLLYAIGWVDDQYLKEMEAPVVHHRSRRIWLLAAVIAALLILAGCVAVFNWLNSRSIGQETYTQRFDAQGHYIEPTEKTVNTVTLLGAGGSPMQKALSEWISFYTNSWDLNLTEEDYAKVPEQYQLAYNCYTPEMVEKLKGIAQKYNLKLLETEIGFQRNQYQAVLEGLGLSSILRTDGGITMGNGQGGVRPPRNLYMEFFADIPEIEANWARNIYIEYTYGDSAYFPGFGTTTLDLEEYSQWKYTAADGTPLLLALNQKGRGIILAEREDAMIAMQIDSNLSGANFPKPEDVMDQAGLEKLADGFDYTIAPQAVEAPALQKTLNEIWNAYSQQVLDSVKKYGSFTDYLLREGHRVAKANYYFRDLDGNGMEEMILEFPNDVVSTILSIHEGKVYANEFLPTFRLLENGGLMSSEDQGGKQIYWFYLPQKNGYPFSFTYEGYSAGPHMGDSDTTIAQENGSWWESGPDGYGSQRISDDLAKEVLAQHQEVKISKLPLWEYPIDETGKTLGQELSSRKNPVTQEEAQAFYSKAVQENELRIGDTRRFYCLRDIDGDGSMDILFSDDGKNVNWSYRSRYGKVLFYSGLFTEMTEDYVYIYQGNRTADDGADLAYYQYFTRGDSSMDILAEFQCNLANGQWTNLLTEESMTETEARAIIDYYSPVELSWRPIRELTQK